MKHDALPKLPLTLAAWLVAWTASGQGTPAPAPLAETAPSQGAPSEGAPRDSEPSPTPLLDLGQLGGAEPIDGADPAEELSTLGDSVQQLLGTLWAPQSRYTNSPHLRRTFRPVVAEAREATVEVRSRRRRVAYGVVVGPDGWIVTKGSVLRDPVTCRFANGRELAAKVVGIDRDVDLGMLKVAAADLTALDLAPSAGRDERQVVALRRAEPIGGSAASSPPALRPGDWLATVGLGSDAVGVGVVSVLPREIPKQPGFLGVGLDLEYTPPTGGVTGVRIETVTPDGAALEAGLLPGDLVLRVDNRTTPSPQDLKEAVSARHPGDRVEVEVQRDDQRMVVVAVLRGWAPNPAERRAFYQNQLGGELSERRFGFPAALQHDTALDPDQCGGPVVNLDGEVVGINIARAGRTETYALPVELVAARLLDLMSGRLAPIGEKD